MSQWVRGGLAFFSSGAAPSSRVPSMPFLHGHFDGISASSANGTSKISQVGIDKMLGGNDSFENELVDGMNSTLAKIKQAVEQR